MNIRLSSDSKDSKDSKDLISNIYNKKHYYMNEIIIKGCNVMAGLKMIACLMLYHHFRDIVYVVKKMQDAELACCNALCCVVIYYLNNCINIA